MANAWAPKAVWRQVSISVVTVSGNAGVTASVANSKLIRVGQVVSGTGIASGSVVISVNAATGVITLSQNATASGTITALFKFEYQFEFPPEDDQETPKTAQTTTTSLDGTDQVQSFHIETIRKLKFKFINNTDKVFLEKNFFKEWAMLGKEFSWTDDPTYGSTFAYTLNQLQVTFDKDIRRHPYFLYKFEMQIRRAEAV